MILPSQTTKQYLIVPANTSQSVIQINIVLPNYNNIDIYINNNIVTKDLYNINISGLITFTSAIQGYAEIVIINNLPYSKPFDFSNASEWNSQEVNKQLTDPIIQIQQLLDLIPFKSRPEEYITYIIPKLADRKNKFMVFDENGALSISNADFDKLPEYVELAKQYAINSENSATLSSDNATNSANSATLSSDNATNSANSASNASSSASNASSSASNANSSAILAENWANSETEVQPGKYSAKYWAQQSSLIAIPNNSITDDKIFDNANIKRKKLNKAFYDGYFGNYMFILSENIPIFENSASPISESLYNMQFTNTYFTAPIFGLYKITICFNITQIPNTPSINRGIYVTTGIYDYILADLSHIYTQNCFGCSYTGYFTINAGFTLSYNKGSESYEPFHISELRINAELITEIPY